MIKSSIKIVLDSKPLSNGKHAVYLRIIKNRKRKNISIGLQCDKKHFKNETFTRHHPNHQLENELLLRLKTRALETIRNFQFNQTDFSLKEFEDNFRGSKKPTEIKVISFFNEIIDEMIRSGRISNAKAYKDTKDSLTKFYGNDFSFKDITPTFLEKYEVFLREKGNKNGGISFKMR